MQGRFFVSFAVCLTALPAFVVAQQAPVSVPVVAPAPSKAPMPSAPMPSTPVQSAPVPSPAVPSPVLVPVPSPAPLVVTDPEITVNIGGAKPVTGSITALPKAEFDLPAGLIPPATTTPARATAPAPLLPTRPAPAAPPAKLTPAQIAQQIAPNFNVSRDYVRLTQCYGIADFMGAVTRIQASRPGATPQVINVARSIATLQNAMQPMVLAASTVRTEARFRADYDAIARRGQQELASSRTPNVTMQRRLASLDACRADVVRWRGGR
jgi:hypothetical protein